MSRHRRARCGEEGAVKRQIVIEIDCEDDNYCGECYYISHTDDEMAEESVAYCALDRDGDCYMRNSNCLAAESKLRALVDAGNRLCDQPASSASVKAWDAVLAALRGEGE